jgi:hypothetical protein
LQASQAVNRESEASTKDLVRTSPRFTIPDLRFTN